MKQYLSAFLPQVSYLLVTHRHGRVWMSTCISIPFSSVANNIESNVWDYVIDTSKKTGIFWENWIFNSFLCWVLHACGLLKESCLVAMLIFLRYFWIFMWTWQCVSFSDRSLRPLFPPDFFCETQVRVVCFNSSINKWNAGLLICF